MATLEDTVSIVVDEQAIAGTFVTPKTLVPGVLFVHGWGGSQDQYLARAREIASLGCVCLTFNLRGHVETRPLFETVSREINLRDVRGGLRHARRAAPRRPRSHRAGRQQLWRLPGHPS